MNILSPYVLAVALSWVLVQGLKYAITVIKTGDMKNIRQLYLSGNMPSAHTASVVSLVTIIGLKDGVNSGLFGLAVLFGAIVMYDAIMVRRSVGEQGQAIQELIKESKTNIPFPRAAKGHTPAEVVVGALFGLVIGIVVFLATK